MPCRFCGTRDESVHPWFCPRHPTTDKGMRAIYDPRVSRHALERFCERFGEIEPGAAERMILTPEVREWVSWGATRITNFQGMTLVAVEGVITSVWPADWRDRRGKDRVA